MASGFFGEMFDSFLKQLGLKKSANSIMNRITQEHLTGAQQEANAFSAEQASIQRGWEQEMSNTAYQRQVSDMQAAGVNPALIYGNGASGASTPSSSAPGSVSPDGGSIDPIGLIGQLANLSLLKSQRANIDADTANKLADSDLKKVNADKVKVDIEHTRNLVDGSVLDNDAKRITNSFLIRQQEAALAYQSASTDQLKADKNRLDQFVNNLKADELKSYISFLDTLEHIQNLRKERELSDAQIKELSALAAQANAMAKNINLQNDNFDYINGVTVNGSVGIGPFKGSSSEFVPLWKLRSQAESREEILRKKYSSSNNFDNGLGMDYHDWRID